MIVFYWATFLCVVQASPLYTDSEEDYLAQLNTELECVDSRNHTHFVKLKLLALRKEKKDEQQRANAAENKISCLEQQIINSDKYKDAVVVRSRIEYLEDVLHPPRRSTAQSRKTRWQIILAKTNPNVHVSLFRMRVIDAYCFEEKGGKRSRIRSDNMGINLFSSAIQRIYGDISGTYRGPHNLIDPEVLLRLHSNNSEALALLKTLSVHHDTFTVMALQLVASDLDLPKPNGKINSCESPLKHMVIYPEKQGFDTRIITLEDVAKLFPGMKINLNSENTKISRNSIIIDFEDEESAVAALNNFIYTLQLENKPAVPIKVELTDEI